MQDFVSRQGECVASQKIFAYKTTFIQFPMYFKNQNVFQNIHDCVQLTLICTCVSGESAVVNGSSTTKILPVAVHCIYTLSIFPSDKYQAWNRKNAKKKIKLFLGEKAG